MMSQLISVVLHAGPGLMPSISVYAVGVLLHAMGIIGLAVLVHSGIVALRATRAWLDPEGQAGSADLRNFRR